MWLFSDLFVHHKSADPRKTDDFLSTAYVNDGKLIPAWNDERKVLPIRWFCCNHREHNKKYPRPEMVFSKSRSEAKFNKVGQLFNMVWLMHSMIIEKNCLKAFCKFSLIRAKRKELKCWKTKSFLIIFPFCSACLLGLGSLPSTTYNFFILFFLLITAQFIPG